MKHALLLCVAFSVVVAAQQPGLRVDAGDRAYATTLLELPEDAADVGAWGSGNDVMPVVRTASCDPVHPRAVAWLWLRGSTDGSTRTLNPVPAPDTDGNGAEWWSLGVELNERSMFLKGKRFLSTVSAAYDSQKAEDTMKPWQELFASDGALKLTKGAGGKYPHHRGVFLGWNSVEHAGAVHDFWHCRKGLSIRHRRFLDGGTASGPAAARLAMEHEWCLADGKPVVNEVRSLTAFNGDGFRALDVAIALRALAGPVKLGGDAHHAGFHVRAADAVCAAEKETKTFLPESARALGNDIHADLHWGAMAFPLEGRTFTVLLIEHPDNPAGSVLSARPYGRMGFMPLATLTPEKPLFLRWRIVVFEDLVREPAVLEMHATTYRAPPRLAVLR
jgi:hypothetical protein